MIQQTSNFYSVDCTTDVSWQYNS